MVQYITHELAGMQGSRARAMPNERRICRKRSWSSGCSGPAQPVKAGALVAPNCAWIHNELKRHRHVTLLLLWEEVACS